MQFDSTSYRYKKRRGRMKVVNYAKIDFCKNQEIIVPSMQYDSIYVWVKSKFYNMVGNKYGD